MAAGGDAVGLAAQKGPVSSKQESIVTLSYFIGDARKMSDYTHLPFVGMNRYTITGQKLFDRGFKDMVWKMSKLQNGYYTFTNLRIQDGEPSHSLLSSGDSQIDLKRDMPSRVLNTGDESDVLPYGSDARDPRAWWEMETLVGGKVTLKNVHVGKFLCPGPPKTVWDEMDNRSSLPYLSTIACEFDLSEVAVPA